MDQVSPADIFQTQHAFGFYSDAEYRANRRWTLGGRFDRSGHAANARLTDTGFSAILTYWPSEFSQIRGQYRFGHLAVGGSGDVDGDDPAEVAGEKGQQWAGTTAEVGRRQL